MFEFDTVSEQITLAVTAIHPCNKCSQQYT